jgi:hypothetical protein
MAGRKSVLPYTLSERSASPGGIAASRGIVGSWRLESALPARFGRCPIGKLVLLTLLLLAGAAALVGRSELQYRELSEAIDAHVATYQRQRWERPVLRGTPVDGNAAVEGQRALEGFTQLAPEVREALALLVHFGGTPSAEQQALLDAHASRIAGLRAATQRTWAVTALDPAQPDNPRPPDYVRFVDAMLIVLGDASRTAPEVCLPAAVDAIRLGQDLVAGAPLEAASVSMRITSIATPVLTRCARGASYTALLAAARELHSVAAHPPPTFGGIELADTQMLVRVRELGVAWPVPAGESPIARLRRRPALAEAFKHFDKPARWRALSPSNYPDALNSWLEEQEWRGRSTIPMVAKATPAISGWLFDDMRGQALVRVLTVGFATLAERENRQRMPREPLNLTDPVLRDPFNGRPLAWRIAHDGGELTIWSVGEDRRDDKGSSEWTEQAPIDIRVHFPLRAPEKQAAKTARAAR